MLVDPANTSTVPLPINLPESRAFFTGVLLAHCFSLIFASKHTSTRSFQSSLCILPDTAMSPLPALYPWLDLTHLMTPGPAWNPRYQIRCNPTSHTHTPGLGKIHLLLTLSCWHQVHRPCDLLSLSSCWQRGLTDPVTLGVTSAASSEFTNSFSSCCLSTDTWDKEWGDTEIQLRKI